ncbi:hypothetical protein ACM66B_000661 [Microbotryomycetes sp. NB124-2]
MRRSTALQLLLLSITAFLETAFADRKFHIKNMCSYTLWPAVTSFKGAEFAVYDKGKRGWEAPPGHEEVITIPEKWNGRIGIRRGCSGEGKSFKCLMADTPGGLEPDLFVLTPSNLGEFNLAGWQENDFWDISLVPGIVAPMSIEPHHFDCTKVICAQDVIFRCPNELAVKDPKTQEILGCRSACFAGINAQEPSLNCCSGKYNSMEACPSEKVEHYQFFKDMCPMAYAAPYDFDPRLKHPVDYVCPNSAKTDYTITFCPAGDGKPKDFKSKEDKPKDEKPKDEKPKDEKPKDEKPQEEEAKPKDEKPKDEKPKGEDKPKADDKDETNDKPTTTQKPGGGTTTTTTTATDTTTPVKTTTSSLTDAGQTSTEAAPASNASPTSAGDSTASATSEKSGIARWFESVPKTTWYWVGGGAAVVLILLIVLCIFCCRRKKDQQYERAPSEEEEGDPER